MLKFDCHVAVGVSGGKDSVVLLTILSKITLHKTKLTALIVDEGIEGYRPHGVEIAIKTAKNLNLPYKLVSYKDKFGLSLDQMLPAPFGKTSCAICGTFRRKAMNNAVIDLSADFLATGHNMDDEAESVLLNVLRGDSIRFSRQTRKPEFVSEKFIPRIKPLVLVSQPEIVYYAIANNLEYHDDVCPYASQARRNSVREFLQNQEKRHPGTIKNIIIFQDNLLETNNINEKLETNLYECKVCSEPTDSKIKICAGCKFLDRLNN